jgi:hypothetical protein
VRSAPRPHETANGEIEADEHHERDQPLIALRRTERDDKHAAGVDGRRVSSQEGAKISGSGMPVLPSSRHSRRRSPFRELLTMLFMTRVPKP